MKSASSKLFLISLGCPKNLVDSEHMLGLLRSEGFDFATRLEEAETAVINTCAFIQPAVEEAIDTILEVARMKGEGKLKKLVVAGCLVQRYGYKLRREIPEVDAWLGTGEFHRVAEALKAGISDRSRVHISRPTFLPDHTMPREQTTPFYTAYLKIAEGCSHGCSFCIIPHLRGPFRSRPMKSLVNEAERLAGQGVKELNLVAQDTTMYGGDLEGNVSLEGLLERLLQVKGICWIRVLYCHPNGISDRLLDLMDSEERICPYLDIPFQHVNRELLRAMGREWGGHSPRKVVERIRKRKRRISLRTTLMLGFPGEAESEFKELYGFVRWAEFDHLGVFSYSPEEGTRAARLGPNVNYRESKGRVDRILTLQSGISKKNNQRFVGGIFPVLVEGLSRETDLLLDGRMATMAPEVDGQVLINKGEGTIGEIMPVTITEAHAYDLVGEIVQTSAKKNCKTLAL